MSNPICRRALAPVSYESSHTATGANAHRLMNSPPIRRRPLAPVHAMQSLDAEAAEVLETIRGLA